MHTLPYQNNHDLFTHLITWFRYSSSKFSGFNRLEQIWTDTTDNANDKSVSTELYYHPLTPAEEQRWQTLERKAKQENLSGHDAAEYDLLLEIKLYNRYKMEQPSFTHEALLAAVRQAL